MPIQRSLWKNMLLASDNLFVLSLLLVSDDLLCAPGTAQSLPLCRRQSGAVGEEQTLRIPVHAPGQTGLSSSHPVRHIT